MSSLGAAGLALHEEYLRRLDALEKENEDLLYYMGKSKRQLRRENKALRARLRHLEAKEQT